LRRIALAVLIVATLALDQGTKALARQKLRGTPPREHGVLTLVYAENTGAFLSLGASLPRMARRILFDGLVAVGLGVAVWVLFTGRVHGGGDDVALSLIIAGGVGNLIDRFLFGGHVTDFLYLRAGPLHTGVFNAADMAITGGVLWLALAWIFKPRKRAD
jgi:signal peptidase II